VELAIQGVVFLVVFICLGEIAVKAGYPRWYRLAMLVPVLNLVVLVLFAFSEWPLEEQAYRYRMQEADEELRDPGYLVKRWVRKAIAFEREGRVEEAIRLYERVAASDQAGNAELARAAVARLRAAQAAASGPPGTSG
jgi:tetratricopeptide (TPR) repeat protein